MEARTLRPMRLLGTALSFALLSTAAARGADLTIGAFGGIFEESLRKCSVQPFTAKTGKTVEIVFGSPVQWLNQIAASPAHPPLDIIFDPAETVPESASRGLVDKLTVDKVPALAQMDPTLAKVGDGYGQVHNYGAIGILFNKEAMPKPPDSWKEYYDGVAAGKWKAAMQNVNMATGGLTGSIWQMAELYGGSVENIQPGLDKVRQLRDSGNMTFFSDPNQILNGLRNGELDVVNYYDGRAWSFISDGNDNFGFKQLAPGGVSGLMLIQKVKNGSDLAWDFINFALSAEAQGCFGSNIRYGVGNAQASFDPAVKPFITPVNQLALAPFDKIIDRKANWIEEWNKQIGR